MILRGADGLYAQYSGNDRLGNQGIAFLCGQAGLSDAQTNRVVAVAEFAQMALEMYIGGKFSSGSFSCFVAGTRVVFGEIPDLARRVARLGIPGYETQDESGSLWTTILQWIRDHQILVGIGSLAGGVAIGLVARPRRHRREDLIDAALDEELGLGCPARENDDEFDEEAWDWLEEVPARLRCRENLLIGA
jgi:hypothetical protein